MSLVERGWVMVGHLLQPGQHNHCFQRDAKTSSYIFFSGGKKELSESTWDKLSFL